MTIQANKPYTFSVVPNRKSIIGQIKTTKGTVYITKEKLNEPETYPGINDFMNDIDDLMAIEEKSKPRYRWSAAERERRAVRHGR